MDSPPIIDEFRPTGSIVTHTIPADGQYRFVAIGAKAADGRAKTGGRGARVEATFALARGDVLEILVGTESTRRSGKTDSGGGGGTFVAINGRRNPLIVAGGGGGTRGARTDENGSDASLTEAGGPGTGNRKGAGGAAGRSELGAPARAPCPGRSRARAAGRRRRRRRSPCGGGRRRRGGSAAGSAGPAAFVADRTIPAAARRSRSRSRFTHARRWFSYLPDVLNLVLTRE